MTIGRLRSVLTGFAFAHAVNGGLGMVSTLLQTIIFARVLDRELFAETIAIAAVGIYVAPLNQAVARANFVLLQSRSQPGRSAIHLPEATAAFQISHATMLLLIFSIPAVLGIGSFVNYIALTSFLIFSLYSNIWVFEIQMAMISTEHALLFEWFTLIRKVLHFLVLGWLWLGAPFLSASLALGFIAVAFNAYLMLRMGPHGDLFGVPRGLTRRASREHLSRFWVSLQATFGEWLALSGPYALFTASFGVGRGLIAIDAMMKLVRTCVTISRNLSEIVLMRVATAVSSDNAGSARRFILIALGGGWAAALVLGAVSFFDERVLFNALLGPSNTLPIGAGKAIAVAMFAGCAFAIGSHLIGHTGKSSAVRRILIEVVMASIALTTAMLIKPSILTALWLVAGALVVGAVAALRELHKLVGSDRRYEPPSAS